MAETKTQRHFSFVDLMTLEQRYRASFVNSLSGFKSVSLIGTADRLGQTNLAVFNSLVHIGANPPYLGFINRPDSVDRHTLQNILETGFYTVNHIHESFYMKAHQTSARYPDDVSEFKVTGLKEEYLDGFDAPYVEESFIKMGVRFKEHVPLKINGTIMVIGQIEHVYFPNNCLCNDGFLDIEKAGTVAGSGLDSYHTTSRLNRLTYAKPHKIPEVCQLRYIE